MGVNACVHAHFYLGDRRKYMSRSITIEDLYAIKFLSRPRISPDGQQVAFVVTTIDERKHEYRSSIWVTPIAGGEARRFTGGTANAHSPCWSPDGRRLAFVSDREGELTGENAQEQKQQGKGKSQLWLIPGDGGEAQQLTFMPHVFQIPYGHPIASASFSAQRLARSMKRLKRVNHFPRCA